MRLLHCFISFFGCLLILWNVKILFKIEAGGQYLRLLRVSGASRYIIQFFNWPKKLTKNYLFATKAYHTSTSSFINKAF